MVLGAVRSYGWLYVCGRRVRSICIDLGDSISVEIRGWQKRRIVGTFYTGDDDDDDDGTVSEQFSICVFTVHWLSPFVDRSVAVSGSHSS